MIGTLIWGWILTWFHLDTIITTGINQLFHTDFTTEIYWLILFIIGIIIVLFKLFKEKDN